MRRIGIIDVDGGKSFPNIAMMKLSAYHKSLGDMVEWYDTFSLEPYDLVYMSKVFSFTPDYEYPVNAKEIIKGGSGYCIDLVDRREVFHKERDHDLPDEIEHIYPDYSLYPYLTKDGYLSDRSGCKDGSGSRSCCNNQN